MLKVKQVADKKTWDNFVTDNTSDTFFQSYNWGQVSSNMGEEAFYFGLFENEKLIAATLVLKVIAKRGTFLFCPHGPIFENYNSKNLDFFLNFLKDFAKEQKVDFLRISPLFPIDQKILNQFKINNFANAPIHMSAESMWFLDLVNKTEDQLLTEMRKTTRYEIKKAEKLGFKVIKSTDKADLKHFFRLYKETTKRNNFVPFSEKYITEEFVTFAKDNQSMIFLEEHHQKIVAAIIILFFGKGAFYHQGATIPQPKEAVSYIAQWEAIKEAKSRNMEKYNFWGIAPNDSPKHPWFGLTLFKKGFGGRQFDLLHAQDFPINKLKYFSTYTIETIRRFRRGL